MENSMTKQEIIRRLTEVHQAFTEQVASFSDPEFMYAPAGKWTAGQQVDHIFRSIAPLTKVLHSPDYLLTLNLDKANWPSCSYEELVSQYETQLGKGGVATERFIPKSIELADRQLLLSRLMQEVTLLCSHIHQYTEPQLDDYVLTHPLLGKLTIREMLYFSIYHAQHHQQLTLRNVGR
jgi:hypothetical protein